MKTTTNPDTARWYAAEKHRTQRYGNQPYTYHLEQAVGCLDHKLLSLPALRFYDHDVLRSAVWLHDVVEDTGTSIFELGKLFDPRVVELVDAVTDGPGKNRAERKAPMYEKVRAIGVPALAVKLADRLANALWNQYRGDAKKRNLEFTLAQDFFLELTSAPCTYCESPPELLSRYRETQPYTYTGIDRVDNERGYLRGNVVPCCYRCNRAKGPGTLRAFLAWLARLGATPVPAERFSRWGVLLGEQASDS